MKHWLILTTLFVFPASLSFAQIANANGIVVVANISNNDLTLSKQQIRSLFMGSSVGRDLKVATLPPSSLTRVEFNTKVIGMTESRIQSYWAQMRFSGRKTEPLQFDNENQLIEFLNNTPGAVAYLPASTAIPDNLTVVYSSANN
ncbi:hypothetical protein GCM10009114_18390 [Aliiglaciecola litoralis]|uniref:Phosphate ABC transporter substrate-binding protein n=1 Tax=Aliiglaciecola litoralis TaxID=582857 RepID=A0ABN1LIC0_9ALTE